MVKKESGEIDHVEALKSALARKTADRVVFVGFSFLAGIVFLAYVGGKSFIVDEIKKTVDQPYTQLNETVMEKLSNLGLNMKNNIDNLDATVMKNLNDIDTNVKDNTKMLQKSYSDLLVLKTFLDSTTGTLKIIEDSVIELKLKGREHAIKIENLELQAKGKTNDT